MGGADWRTEAEVTGPVLRLRTFGDDKKRRYYAAVDGGDSRAIRAFRLSASQYAQVEQGQLVAVRLTPNLGCVRWIIRAPDSESAAG
jgi:hypothetical protein